MSQSMTLSMPMPTARRTRWPLYAACLGLPAAAVLLVTLGCGIPATMVLADASAYTRQPFYLGLFSNLGVLGWCTAAVSCTLAALALPATAATQAEPLLRGALVVAGTLSVLLGLDDVLLLHEAALPRLGIH